MKAVGALLLAALTIGGQAFAQASTRPAGGAAHRPSAPSRPSPTEPTAPSPAASVPAPAGQTACGCEQIAQLQQELRNALQLRDRHAAMATQLAGKYGDAPRGEALRDARTAYLAFETGDGAGSAASGIVRTMANAPPAISYIPRGQKLQQDHARDDRLGIPTAERWTADGRPEPDLDLRRKIEAEQRAAGNDLCEFENRAAIDQSATAGAVCLGIARAVVAHEDIHRATCRRMGYYAFAERSPIGLAQDEVGAYDTQIKMLADELRRVLGLPKTKITVGSSGSIEAMLAVQAHCALAININGKIDDLVLKGRVCDTGETFRIPTMPEANMVLTPRDQLSGSYAYHGVVPGAAEFWGSGGYTISLENGKGGLILDGAGRWWARNPVGTASKGGPSPLPITEIREGC